MGRDPGSEVVTNDNRMHLHQMGPVQPRRIQFPPTAFGKKNLKFQPAWYNRYAWLEYSETLDAMFCFYCRLYGSQGGSVKQEFTETWCRNWKNALGEIGKLVNHNICEYKIYSTIAMTSLLYYFSVFFM